MEKISSMFSAAVSPLIPNGTDVTGLITNISDVFSALVPILIGGAIIAFLFGVLRFVFNAGKEDKRAEGRNFMIYGLIGIVVMVSVWGLVRFVMNTLGVTNSGPSSSQGDMCEGCFQEGF
jgi:hypothetical protein